MTRIRHRVCHKLYHLRLVDLAPLKWNVFTGVQRSCFLFLFYPLKRACILQNSSIAHEYRLKFGTSRTRNISRRLSSREQTRRSISTNIKMVVGRLIIRFSVTLTCFFYSKINYFDDTTVKIVIFYLKLHDFEDTTVNTELRGHCESKFNPMSL